MSYLLSNLIATTLEMIAIGSSLYICDIEQKWWVYRILLWFHRKWYDMTHEHPLPEGKVHLVYRAGIRSWVSIAWKLMLIEPAMGYLSWLVFGTRVEFKVEVLTMLPHLFGVLTGFYIGPAVNYLFQRRTKVIDAMEKMEQEGIGEHVKHVRDAATEGIMHVILPDKQKSVEPTVAKRVEDPFDPDKIIRNFRKKNRRE